MNAMIHKRRLAPLVLLASLLALALLCFTTMRASATSKITINDASNVLNVGQVQDDAKQFPDPLLIYTTRSFTGDQNGLNQLTHNYITDQNQVVIGIDTAQRHLSIESGSNVKLSDSQASDAVSAFRSNINGNDYTDATNATIDSLQASITGKSPNGITPFGILMAISLGVIVIIVGFLILRNRRSNRGGTPPDGGGRPHRIWNNGYYGGTYYPGSYNNGGNAGINSGNYGGGAGGSFGGGSFGGGAGGGFGGGGGGAGGSF